MSSEVGLGGLVLMCVEAQCLGLVTALRNLDGSALIF
jgi:hypothetical protein